MKFLKMTLMFLLVAAVLFAGIPFFGMGSLNLFSVSNIGAEAATTYTSDKLTYTVSGSGATIIGYSGTPLVVEIPSTIGDYTVVAIGDEAFKNEVTLLGITIADTVKKIGDSAFSGCTLLNSLTLGSGLTTIGEAAFEKCSNLESVTIPKSVTDIGDGAFAYCTALTGFTVASTNLFYKSSGNVLYNYARTHLVAYPASMDSSAFTIPAAVTAIDSYAFSNSVKLETVTLQANVSTIGAYAFVGSKALKTIDMSESSLTVIGTYAFKNCTALATISLPGTVSAVGVGGFSGCTALKSAVLSSKMTVISDNLFDGCKSLKSLSIPSKLTTIGEAAFRNCSSMPSAVIPNNVISLGDLVFSNCSSLKSVTIGSKVKSVNGEMFSGCTAIAEFKLSDTTYFNVVDGVLLNATKTKLICYPAGKTATSYTVPSTVKSIGKYAFANCANLKGLTVPSTVTSIETSAVAGCSSLIIYCTAGSTAETFFEKNTSGYASLRVSGTSPRFTVSNASGKAGNTVNVTVSLENNPGITAAAFTIKYDATKVSLKSVKDGGILEGFSYTNRALLSYCKINFVDNAATKNNTKNGTVVTLTFELLSGFTSGTSALTITMDESNTYDASADSVAFKTSNGSITIGSKTIPGDVNSDGNVDSKDSTLLKRYVAGWKNITIDDDCADVNGDGNINAKDATVLRRYVAGWSGVTLK